MYTRIKELADSAVALQNKINMEAALREISGICDMAASPLSGGVKIDYEAPADNPVLFGDGVVAMPAGEELSVGDAVVQVAGKAKKAAKK